MYIDCVGMMRSGSTLQYNIVAEIIELKNIGKKLGWERHEEFFKIKEKYENDKLNVFKNHFLTDEIENELKQVENSVLMYVYRDIRDVCVSLMEKENKTFEQIFSSKMLHNAIEQYYKITNSSLKKYIQSYEVMFLNTKKEITQVAKFLDIELTFEEIESIYNKISFESQKENIEKYKENSEYISNGKQKFSADTLLHLNHIKDGGIGKYKQRLSKVQIEKIEDEFFDWLSERDYKLESKTQEREPLRRYYSQHGEDYLLWKFFDFKKDGFFVEVGAFDGIHLSNSYSFELEGWRGICVEPGQYFENCKKNRPNSICINAACVSSEETKEITFYEEELGLLSSLDMSSEKKEDIEKRYENRKLDFSGHKERTVKAQTLNAILEENKVSKIDFITIDVEGAEIEVLKGFDLDKYQPSVVILEANDENHKQELIQYMTIKNEYIFVREVSVNLVFIHNKEDFNKMRNIEINCTIEKQVHPLGDCFTSKEFMYGLRYIKEKNINNLYLESIKRLQEKEEVIKNTQKRLQEKEEVIKNTQKRLQEKEEVIKNTQKRLQEKEEVIKCIYQSIPFKFIKIYRFIENTFNKSKGETKCKK